MKLSVLDEIVSGEFSESLNRLSPKGKTALSEVCRLEKELTSDFDEERKKKFEELMNAHRQSLLCEQTTRFKLGVRLGLLLCFETFDTELCRSSGEDDD